MDTGIPTPNTDQLIAAKKAISEFEEITEVAKPAAPKSKHKIIQVKDVRVGDLIFLHTLGAGPYLVDRIDSPNHPAVRKSAKTIWVKYWCNAADQDIRGWYTRDFPLSYQFTQNHMDVELWNEPETRKAYNLSEVNP